MKSALTIPRSIHCSCPKLTSVNASTHIRTFATNSSNPSLLHSVPTSVVKGIKFKNSTDVPEPKLDFKIYIHNQIDQLVQRSKQTSKSALQTFVTNVLTDLIHDKQLYLSEDAETRDVLLSSFNRIQKLISPTIKHHNIILEFLGRANHFDHMIQQFELMKKEKKFNLQSFDTVLSHLGSCPKQVPLLMKYFGELKSKYPDEVEDYHYAIVIDSLCKAGKLEDAVEVFKEITTPNKFNISVSPTIMIVNNLLQGLNINNRPNEIPNLLRGMISQFRIQPNQITFDILIETFIETLPSSENLLTHEIFKLLIELQPTPQILTNLLSRTITRFQDPPQSRESSIITKLSSEAQEQLLLNIFEVMKVLKLEINVFHYSVLMSYFTKKGNGKKVLELYKEMESSGIKPSHYIFHSLMIAYNTLGNLEEALKYWKKLQQEFHSHLSVRDYTYVLKMLARNGRSWTELEKLFNDVGEKNLEYDIVFFNTMLGALDDLKLPPEETNQKVIQLLEKMKKLKLKADSTTYQLLLRITKPQNNPQLAWSFLNILSPKIRSPEVNFFAALMNQSETTAAQALEKIDPQNWDSKKIQDLLSSASQQTPKNPQTDSK